MDSIGKLTELFKEFPGIGARQAGRFVYFLLSKNSGYLETLSKLILSLKREIKSCSSCFRFFPETAGRSALCEVCRDKSRDNTLLMVVPRDIDWKAVEKSGSYRGFYFILGGTVPILEKAPERRVRVKELLAAVRAGIEAGLKEIIIAASVNPEGENTQDFIVKTLSPIAKEYGLKISGLGRGLSTGAELEYSDSDTIKNALRNRF